MVRMRDTAVVDPATGKLLADGVSYRGPAQYRARKLVDGHRITKTFTKAALAGRWLEEAMVDRRRGVFVDRSRAKRTTRADVIRQYQKEILGTDSEKRGAAGTVTKNVEVREVPCCPAPWRC